MRKSKYYCAMCRKWKPYGEWESTYHPHFNVQAWGMCESTQRDKLNFQRACRHFVMNTELGIFGEFHY